MLAIYWTLLAIVLAPPAVALRQRMRSRPESRIGVVALRSAAWALLGLLVAIVVALAFDLSGLPIAPSPAG